MIAKKLGEGPALAEVVEGRDQLVDRLVGVVQSVGELDVQFGLLAVVHVELIQLCEDLRGGGVLRKCIES